jgi:GDP-D-mannose dehydratase
MLLANSPTPIELVVDQDLVRPSDVPIVYGSPEKANRAFGFRPSTDIEDALKSAWEFAVIGVPGCA